MTRHDDAHLIAGLATGEKGTDNGRDVFLLGRDGGRKGGRGFRQMYFTIRGALRLDAVRMMKKWEQTALLTEVR